MRPNHEYWCKCTWRTNGINKTATSDRLHDLRWQLGFQWHRGGIELVFKSLDCFTKWLFHSATIFFAATYVFVVWNFTRLITRLKRVFLTSISWGSTQLQCIYYLRRILISRPPRVFRRFKRRSCLVINSVVNFMNMLTNMCCIAGLGSNMFYQIQIQIQKIGFFIYKYKYKYFIQHWLKYKYKYIASNTNTNTFNQIYLPKLCRSKIGQFYESQDIYMLMACVSLCLGDTWR